MLVTSALSLRPRPDAENIEFLPPITSRQAALPIRLPPGRHAMHSVYLGEYTSLVALRHMLELVEESPGLAQPTVVLILAADFSGHLPSLVRRSRWGCRLVLAVEGGRVPLPGNVTLGDLVLHEGALGWGQIVFERDLAAAIRDSLESLGRDEPLILAWPSRMSTLPPLDLLDRPDCQVLQLESVNWK